MTMVGSVYPAEIWANESLIVLRDNLVLARLVHRDFEPVVAAYGYKVHTRKPVKLPVKTFAGQSGTNATSTIEVDNLNALPLSVTLDQHKYAAFIIEDVDASTSIKDLREEFIMPAIEPVAHNVDDALMTELFSTSSTDVHGTYVVSVADSTVGLGAAMDEDDIVAARKKLNDQQCPTEGRRLVVSTEHEADLLKSDLFVQVQQSGSTEALVNAQLGRKLGFDIYMSQNVPTAVDTDSTAQSIAFHRNAITLVTRPLNKPNAPNVASAVADLDGIGIRVQSAYDINKLGTVVAVDLLYGVQLLDHYLACIINP